jgi:DNA ligase-associated metallophosphoesterase
VTVSPTRPPRESPQLSPLPPLPPLITQADGAVATRIAARDVRLLPDAAIWFPDSASLFVADPHFGKSATFRAQALAIPGGVTSNDLARLDRVLARTAARRLVVLGDFLHARAGRAPRTLEAIAAWRARHAALRIVLVRGNHDRHAGDPPRDLAFDCVDGPWFDPETGIALRHEPEDSQGADYTLAGHVHPAVRLLGGGRQAETLPCFHLAPRVGVLPAFGSFTGCHRVRPRRGDRVAVIASGQVLALDTPDGVP